MMQNNANELKDTQGNPKVTLRSLKRMADAEQPFACLTCYDASTARLLEDAGVHLLLVGDTAAEVILGLPSTVHMPLDISIALTAAVKRGAPNTVVMGDMPFLSYHGSLTRALDNAGRYLTEGMADIVKLEADRGHAELVREIVRAGIPVCGHVGSKPQRVAVHSGYKAAGRTEEDAQAVVDDAIALEEAGASMLLVEAVPPEVAARIMSVTSVPLIGIGAGPMPHGQILVLQDILGITQWSPPFAPRYGEVGSEITRTAAAYVQHVRERTLTEHAYRKQDHATESAQAR